MKNDEYSDFPLVENLIQPIAAPQAANSNPRHADDRALIMRMYGDKSVRCVEIILKRISLAQQAR